MHDHVSHLRQRGGAGATINQRLAALRSLIRLARSFDLVPWALDVSGEPVSGYREGMDLTEAGAYVKHHLSLAGRSDTLFSDDALAVIHQASRGLPRAVNNLALQALVATFAQDKSIVDESAAKMAVVEVAGE